MIDYRFTSKLSSATLKTKTFYGEESFFAACYYATNERRVNPSHAPMVIVTETPHNDVGTLVSREIDNVDQWQQNAYYYNICFGKETPKQINELNLVIAVNP